MAVVNNVIDDFFNLPRTDETRQNYVDFQAGKIDIFGNPKGTNLAESMANPSGMLSEGGQEAVARVSESKINEENVSEAPSMLSENNQINISQRQANIKQELEKQYAVLKSQGFDYVNDSDLDYIFTEQDKLRTSTLRGLATDAEKREANLAATGLYESVISTNLLD